MVIQTEHVHVVRDDLDGEPIIRATRRLVRAIRCGDSLALVASSIGVAPVSNGDDIHGPRAVVH